MSRQPILWDASVTLPVSGESPEARHAGAIRATSTRQSHVEALAVYFRQHAGQWVSSMELMPIGGWCSWRTRISDLRKAPYSMQIENHSERDANGRTRSFYRYQGPR